MLLLQPRLWLLLPQQLFSVLQRTDITDSPHKSFDWYALPLQLFVCYEGIVWEPFRENELTRNSLGNTRPQSSQLAEPLWTDPGLKKKGEKR